MQLACPLHAPLLRVGEGAVHAGMRLADVRSGAPQGAHTGFDEDILFRVARVVAELISQPGIRAREIAGVLVAAAVSVTPAVAATIIRAAIRAIGSI